MEIEGAQHVAAERLVARLHVGQRRVVEDVREQRQEAVPKQVPEQVRPLRPPARKPGAEDDVGDAAVDRLDQRRHVGRVVLEIGVLDDSDVAVHVRNRRPNGGALAAVLLTDQHDGVLPCAPLFDEVAAAVGRAVVDDDDLLVELERPDGVEHGHDRRGLVVGRYEEGDPHGGAA